MSKQHIVPQQMIRRFANKNGELAELLKPELALATRWKSPKEILWADDYYKDIVRDLDTELFKKVEQRFALHYPALADKPIELTRIVGDPASALIDWIASMLARTQMIVLAAAAVARKDDPRMHAVFTLAPALVSNTLRVAWYDQMRDLMTRPRWKWRMICIKGNEVLILTDNPVLLFRPKDTSGFSVVAPLASRRVLIGGPDLPQTFRKDLVPAINRLMTGWAYSRVYSGSREQLEELARQLSEDNDWSHEARRPLFGHPDRVMTMRSPVGNEAEVFWKNLLNSLGPSPFFNEA